MQVPHESSPRPRSGFVAAFLSMLFPGLGHVYLGAYRRGLGWAAPPFLAAALAAGLALRMDPRELAGEAIQDWFLNGLFIANLVLLGYRALAILDAWAIARRLGGRGPSRRPATLPVTSLLSIAGLVAVLAVMSVAHVAVARYDVLLSSAISCGFENTSADCAPTTSPEPGTSEEPSDTQPSDTQPSDTTAPGTVGPPVESPPTSTAWDGTSRLNILLIGADEQNGAHNTDTMITVSIDPATSQIVMFQLPRDTVDVPIPPGPARALFGSTYQGKINAWWVANENHTDFYPAIPGIKGGPGYNALKAILGNLYGLNIQYFVEVNFAGFTKIVDALGGVTINVQIPVVDDHYPGVQGALQRLYIPAGLQHMDGAAALQYARSRHTSSDFDRGARQQRVLVSLREQVNLSTILPSFDALTQAVKGSFITDIPRSLIPQLITVADKIDARSIRSVIFTPPYYQVESLSGPRGYTIDPRIDRIRAAVRDAFKVDPGFAEARDAVAAEGAAVWVLNGSGLTGQAATLAAYLDYLGIDATAPSQKPDTTGLSGTIIRAYNGAEAAEPLTAAALQSTFHAAVVPVSDPNVRVDFVVITAKSTPLLTPPPVP